MGNAHFFLNFISLFPGTRAQVHGVRRLTAPRPSLAQRGNAREGARSWVELLLATAGGCRTLYSGFVSVVADEGHWAAVQAHSGGGRDPVRPRVLRRALQGDVPRHGCWFWWRWRRRRQPVKLQAHQLAQLVGCVI